LLEIDFLQLWEPEAMKRNFYLLFVLFAVAIGLAAFPETLDAQILRRDRPVLGRVVEQVRDTVRDVLPSSGGNNPSGQLPPAPRPTAPNLNVPNLNAPTPAARAQGSNSTGILRAATASETQQSQAAAYSDHAQSSPNQSVIDQPSNKEIRKARREQAKLAKRHDPSAIYFDPRTGQYYYRTVPQTAATPNPANPSKNPAANPTVGADANAQVAANRESQPSTFPRTATPNNRLVLAQPTPHQSASIDPYENPATLAAYDSDRDNGLDIDGNIIDTEMLEEIEVAPFQAGVLPRLDPIPVIDSPATGVEPLLEAPLETKTEQIQPLRSVLEN